MVEYPPALALFDDELVQDTTDGDVQFSGEDAIVRLRNLISAHSDGQVGQGWYHDDANEGWRTDRERQEVDETRSANRGSCWATSKNEKSARVTKSLVEW